MTRDGGKHHQVTRHLPTDREQDNGAGSIPEPCLFRMWNGPPNTLQLTLIWIADVLRLNPSIRDCATKAEGFMELLAWAYSPEANKDAEKTFEIIIKAFYCVQCVAFEMERSPLNV